MRTPFARKLALLGALIVGLSGASAADAAVVVDPALAQAVATAEPGERLRAIATFDTPLGTAGAASVLGLVAKGQVLQEFPMALLVATPEELAPVQALPGVRSLYLDRRLDY